MDQQRYRRLICGESRTRVGTPIRWLLILLSWPYGLVVRLRNYLYSVGVLKTHKVEGVVISVGNVTTGGTGKTPLVAWLAHLLQEKGTRTAILTRGYKTETGPLADEPAELASMCPETPVIVKADRVAGAAEAIRNHGARVLLLDDGFQHRRLARDLDMVTVDATRPFGYGRLLPAGLLREPLSGFKRADAVVMTRCDHVAQERLEEIERRIRQINPQVVVARSIHAPVNATGPGGAEIGLEELRGKKILAFCGLGNPDAFFDTVRRLGGTLVGSRAFDDHYKYTDGCLGQIRAQAEACRAELVLTTPKDWTKIAPLEPWEKAPPLACLAVKLDLITGAEALTALIDRTCAGRIPAL